MYNYDYFFQSLATSIAKNKRLEKTKKTKTTVCIYSGVNHFINFASDPKGCLNI